MARYESKERRPEIDSRKAVRETGDGDNTRAQAEGGEAESKKRQETTLEVRRQPGHDIAHDETVNLPEDYFNPLVIENCSWCKAYLEQRVFVHAHILARLGDKSGCGYLCVGFYNAGIDSHPNSRFDLHHIKLGNI